MTEKIKTLYFCLGLLTFVGCASTDVPELPSAQNDNDMSKQDIEDDETNDSGQFSCGNGILDIGEQCDGGLNLPTCNELGLGIGTVECSADCKLIVNKCNAHCGNGILEPDLGEQCDGMATEATCSDGSLPTCNDTCMLMPCPQLASCNDGILNQDEEGTDCGGSTCQKCPDSPGVATMALSETHICAIMKGNTSTFIDGEVFCIGRNSEGELGDGSGGLNQASIDFVKVQGLPAPAKHIALYRNSSIAILETGEIFGWGSNDKGQLGLGSNQNFSSTAVRIPGTPNDPVSLHVDEAYVCVLSASGDVSCWGAHTTSPTIVPGMQGVVKIVGSTTKNINTNSDTALLCGLMANGTVRCTTSFTESQAVDGVVAATDIVAGRYSACARSNSEIKCIDKNFVGGGLGDSYPIVGINEPSHVDLDLDHICMAQNNRVYCQGIGRDGRLGTGKLDNETIPAEIAMGPFEGITTIALGENHSCLLESSGMPKCWGKHNSQTGQTNNFASNVPVEIPLPDGVRLQSIQASLGYTCGLTQKDSHLYCWGNLTGSRRDLRTPQKILPTN